MYYAPTLSTSGYAKTPETIIDTIMLNYCTSNTLQTLLFKGRVKSLSSSINKTNGDMDRMTAEIKNDLETIYARYFPEGATVEITYNTLSEDTSKINLNFKISVSHEGVIYDAATEISKLNTNFVDLTEIDINTVVKK